VVSDQARKAGKPKAQIVKPPPSPSFFQMWGLYACDGSGDVQGEEDREEYSDEDGVAMADVEVALLARVPAERQPDRLQQTGVRQQQQGESNFV
jgi:hypothetical protein